MRLCRPLGLVLCCFILWSAGGAAHEIAAGARNSQHRSGDLAASHVSPAILAVALAEEDAIGDAPLAGALSMLANASASALWPKWSTHEAPIAPRRLADARPTTLVGIVVLVI